MNRLKTYSLYVKNAMWFMFLRFKGNRIDAPVRQLIGKWSTIEVNKRGKLSLGNKLFTRTGFHVLVDSGICEIGNNCFFNHNCSITCLEKISIGNRCTFGNNVVIVDHDHSIHGEKTKFVMSPVTIEDGAWIGANVVILKGVTIGKGAVIAAGSTVAKDIPENTVYINETVKKIRNEGGEKQEC